MTSTCNRRLPNKARVLPSELIDSLCRDDPDMPMVPCQRRLDTILRSHVTTYEGGAQYTAHAHIWAS